jgi:hypothetical protein
MEQHVANLEPLLIENLSFKLKESAQYITSRRQVTYYASGSNVYSTVGGTRTLTVTMNGLEWIDPSTVHLQYDLRNTDITAGKSVRPVSGAHCFFQRLRIMTGHGTLVEDISDYNQVHELFSNMKPLENVENDDILAFGSRVQNTAVTRADLPGVPAGQHMTVSFKPLCGLFSQDKYLPLKYLNGLTLEFTLVGNSEDCIISVPVVDVAGTAFLTTNTSNSWQIENVQVKAQVVSLDNTMQNQYNKHMLDGGNLPIRFSSIVTSKQHIGTASNDIAINVTRAFTKLQSLYVTMYRNPNIVGMKKFNYFMHPIGVATTGNVVYARGHELSFQASIGSRNFPEFPIASVSEAYSHLKQASSQKTMSPTFKQYLEHKFAFGLDLETVSHVGFTGLNTKNGELLTIRLKAENGNVMNAAANMPTEITVYLVAEAILEASDSGSSIFD